jgi:hypothetical protein
MADLKIYNNGENKILLSAGDRIIRQPYEFNIGFNNSLITAPTCYFEGEGPLPSNWGWIAYIGGRAQSYSDVYLMQAIMTSLNLADNFVIRSNSNLPNIYDSVSGTQTFSFPTTPQSVRYVFSREDGFFVFTRQTLLAYSPTPRNEADRDRLRIGVSGFYTNNAADISGRLNFAILHKIYIINQEYSNSELLYANNNSLLQDLQFKRGIVSEYEFHPSNLKEITYQGQPVVGMEDVQGNRHLKLVGLPAGTIEEQIEWARANLYTRPI